MSCVKIDFIFGILPGITSSLIFKKASRIFSVSRSFSLEISPRQSSLFQFDSWQQSRTDVCLLNILTSAFINFCIRDIFLFCISLNIEAMCRGLTGVV